MSEANHTCAACGVTWTGDVTYFIHRDGYGIGPEVVICQLCGGESLPTTEELWSWIAERRKEYGDPEVLIYEPGKHPRHQEAPADEQAQVRAIVDTAIAAERKRLAAAIREALKQRDAWTSGPEALELLAQELERE